MAHPARTHAFLWHAHWFHKSRIVQKSWQSRLGEWAGSRPLRCAAWHGHCPWSAQAPAVHSLPALLTPAHRLQACLLASFLPPFLPSLPPFHLVSESRSLLFLLFILQAPCSHKLQADPPISTSHLTAGMLGLQMACHFFV